MCVFEKCEDLIFSDFYILMWLVTFSYSANEQINRTLMTLIIMMNTDKKNLIFHNFYDKHR